MAWKIANFLNLSKRINEPKILKPVKNWEKDYWLDIFTIEIDKLYCDFKLENLLQKNKVEDFKAEDLVDIEKQILLLKQKERLIEKDKQLLEELIFKKQLILEKIN